MSETTVTTTRRARRTRGVLAVIGVLLSCLLLLATVAGVWARRSFLKTDVFADRAGSLIDDPAVQDALATYLTGQINELIDPVGVLQEALPDRADLLAVPLAGAIESFVGDKVHDFVTTEQFADLWKSLVRVAHERASNVLRGDSEIVTTNGDSITIDLLPVINAVLAVIGEQSPMIFGRTVDLPTITVDDVPEEARERLGDVLGIDIDEDFAQFEVYDDGALSSAQDALRIVNRLVYLLVVLTPLLMIGTIAVSARRRRTILQLAVGSAVAMVLLRRVVLIFEDELLKLVRIETNRPAVEVTADTFLDPLFDGAGWIGALALAVAVIALVTGPYPWAVRVRSWVTGTVKRGASLASEKAQDEETARWAQANLDALRIAGAAVGVLLLWWVDLSWVRFFIILIVIGLYELGVAALAARAPAPAEPASP